MSNKLLRIEEVALTINSSVQTINNWYRWRTKNPDNKYAMMLPDYIQNGPKKTRYWKASEMWKLIEFKRSIPHGRNGVLGSITNKRNHNDR